MQGNILFADWRESEMDKTQGAERVTCVEEPNQHSLEEEMLPFQIRWFCSKLGKMCRPPSHYLYRSSSGIESQEEENGASRHCSHFSGGYKGRKRINKIIEIQVWSHSCENPPSLTCLLQLSRLPGAQIHSQLSGQFSHLSKVVHLPSSVSQPSRPLCPTLHFPHDWTTFQGITWFTNLKHIGAACPHKNTSLLKERYFVYYIYMLWRLQLYSTYYRYLVCVKCVNLWESMQMTKWLNLFSPHEVKMKRNFNFIPATQLFWQGITSKDMIYLKCRRTMDYSMIWLEHSIPLHTPLILSSEGKVSLQPCLKVMPNWEVDPMLNQRRRERFNKKNWR